MDIEYFSNNSGGNWWLSDEDWYALEKAGWEVQWKKDDPHYKNQLHEGRWLGALATEAIKRNTTYKEAVSEWETITGEDENDEGCPCCGRPHIFSSYDNKEP
jgi:hypothetical protein